MLAQAGRGFRGKMADAVRPIDSTGLRPAGVGAEWARFSTSVFGAKAHVVYDPDLGRPIYHAVTAANVNDITAAKDMPIEAGATTCSISAIRLCPVGPARCARLPAGDAFQDQYAAQRRARSAACARIDALERPDRLSGRPACDEPEEPAAGRRPRDRGQDRDRRDLAPLDQRSRCVRSGEIADLYKRGWQIELFFRLMKQVLRITKFIGRSENAVRIQIAVALIAFLLLRAPQKLTKETHDFLELVRLVRANLMHRKDPMRLRKPPPPPPLDSRQLQLSLR
jgi:hypothetical protein